ncbi:MAG: Head fiber protein [Bacillota bacterium]|nr:Head fiber protein [Bacillota bacterium]
MGYNTKNYTEQGGEKTVIGGTLEITEDGQVIGLPSGFTPAAFQEDSTATTIEGLVVDFNALLAKLKAAGLMASE